MRYFRAIVAPRFRRFSGRCPPLIPSVVSEVLRPEVEPVLQSLKIVQLIRC